MRYLILTICLVSAIFGQGWTSAPFWGWDSNGDILISGIDSVVVSQRTLGDTTYLTWDTLGGLLYIDLEGDFADSFCGYQVFYDTSTVDFATPGYYIPHVVDTNSFIAWNDSLWALLDSLVAIRDTFQADTNIAWAATATIPDSVYNVNLVSISGDSAAADSAEYFFDGNGIPLKLDKLVIHNASAVACSISSGNGNAVSIGASGDGDNGIYVYGDGSAVYLYGIDRALDIYGYSGEGARIRSLQNTAVYLQSDSLYGLGIIGKTQGAYLTSNNGSGLYCTSLSIDPGIFAVGLASAVTFSSAGSALTLTGAYGTYTAATSAGHYVDSPVGTWLETDVVGLYVDSDSIGILVDGATTDIHGRLSYVDTVNVVLTDVAIDTSGLAQEATLIAARDAIIDSGETNWITSSGDTNTITVDLIQSGLATAANITAAQDAIIANGDTLWTTSDGDTNTITVDLIQSGLATSINVTSAQDAIIANGDTLWTTGGAGSVTDSSIWAYATRTVTGGLIDTVTHLKDSVLVSGIYISPSPFAYATNRQRVANENTPITWAQGEQDSLYWDVDTSIDLTSAIGIFTVWNSYSDSSTIFWDTMTVNVDSSIIAVWLPDSITDTITTGTYPADVWIETSTGRELQIWYKTLRVDKSSRGR